jgi:hypothetical protein
LKGLIKLAAAGVKVREGRSEGVRRHAKRAEELFSQVASQCGQADFCGMSLHNLIVKSRQTQANPPGSSDDDAVVQLVFDWELTLREFEE